MEYVELRPSAPLARLVHCYWSLRGPGSTASAQSIVPDGRMEIVFHLGAPFLNCDRNEIQPSALVVGQMVTRVCLQPTGMVDAFGIRLRPAAAPCFLPGDAAEMLGRIVALSDCLPKWQGSICHRLAQQEDIPARVGVVEAWLLRLAVASPDPVAEAHARFLLNDERVVQSHLGSRQLRRRFRECIGISPKLFERIGRFQRATRLLQSEPLAQAAVLAGYSDQAHLCREFQEFAGTTPKQFVLTRTIGHDFAGA